jgi:DNA-binding NarL/FixJ family response regulator
MGKIRVLIADDHPLIRDRIRQILSDDPVLEVCCEAEDVPEVMAVLSTEKPEVLVLDFNMPGSDGVKTISAIRSGFPETRIVMLTALSEGFIQRKMLEAGASAFISKENASEELVATIRRVAVRNS